MSAELEQRWSALDVPPAAGDLVGEPAPHVGAGAASIAIDHLGRWHLLLAAPDEQEVKSPAIQGLDLRADTLRIGDAAPEQFLDLSCRDDLLRSNFAVLADEVLRELASDPNPHRVLTSVLRRWRRFWSNRPGELSTDDIVGLFGELWFLEHWLGPPDLAAVDAWFGPSKDRHDFRWPAASVEVKTTRNQGDGAPSHRISRLDQLDAPATGDLYLFSLKVALDSLAAGSLKTSIERIREKLEQLPDALAAFEDRLAVAGVAPGDMERYDQRLRVTEERLYRVDAAFPKLTADSFDPDLPAGVEDVTYTLNLSACEAWLIERAPGPHAAALRNGLRATE